METCLSVLITELIKVRYLLTREANIYIVGSKVDENRCKQTLASLT